MIVGLPGATPGGALPRGSVPEVVDHGRSGLVVRDLADFPAALSLAADLDPAACRRHAERNFDLPVMAAGYERLFRAIVEGQRSVRALTGPRPSLRRLRERGVSA